jgi:SAM-dependent methyltransferase
MAHWCVHKPNHRVPLTCAALHSASGCARFSFTGRPVPRPFRSWERYNCGSMFFLRKPRLERLPVAMTGVRMGERALQIGAPDPSLVGAISAKVGLSGHAAVVAQDNRAAERARSAAAQAGALVDVRVQTGAELPFESGAFDVVVLHSTSGAADPARSTWPVITLRECHRVLRSGGRLVIVEGGSRGGALAFLRPKPRLPDAANVVESMSASGFRAARMLAEHEGYRFSEGLK